MDLPIVGVTIDPLWASKLITALADVIDSHDHTEGKGARVPTEGIIIDNDLAINHFSLLDVKTVAMDNQLSSPPLNLETADRLLVSYDDDLWWQVSATQAVQITVGGNLNTGAIATNVWTQVAVDASVEILSTDTFTYVKVDSTSAAVNIDLPSAASTPAGRYYVFKDVGGVALTNNITVTPDGTDTIDAVATTRLININYGSFFLVSNGIDGWNIFRDGHLAATPTQLGVIKLAADLAGPGSTADAPKVVVATDVQAGLITLFGDLTGTYDVPVISTLTGLDGYCTVIPGTQLVFPSTASAKWESGSSLTVESGAIVNIDGAVLTNPTITDGTLDGTEVIAASVSGTIGVEAAGSITFSSGAILNTDTGSTTTLAGGVAVTDPPSFIAPKSIIRSIAMNCTASTPTEVTRNVNALMTTGPYFWMGQHVYFPSTSGSSVVWGGSVCIDQYLIDGSTFSSFAFSVQRGSSDGFVPDIPLAAALCRVHWTTSNLESLVSTGVGGFFLENPYESTAQHTLGFYTDQNNVIDKENYSYTIQLWNEGGDHCSILNKIFGMRIGMTNIIDMRSA